MSRVVWSIAIASFALRIGLAGFLEFGRDQQLHYALGLATYSGGPLAVTAIPNVYTGTACPGVLVPLAFTLPLYLSAGHPLGPAIFLALLNFLVALGMFFLYRQLFRKIGPEVIAAFVFLAPWGILFNPLWQPSLLPACGLIAFYGLTRILAKPRDALGAGLYTAAVALAFQIHLSFVLLLVLVVPLLWQRPRVKIHLSGALAGLAVGLVSVIPYLLNPPASGAQAGVMQNVSTTHAPIVEIIVNVVFRFLSFPTGETTRFIGGGTGFAGALAFVTARPWLWIPFAIGMIASVIMVLAGLRFFVQRPRDRLSQVLRWLPLGAIIVFLGSVKPPSAHTLWILYPIAFFPLFTVIQGLARRVNRWQVVLLVLVSSLIYSIAFIGANYQTSVLATAKKVRQRLELTGYRVD